MDEQLTIADALAEREAKERGMELAASHADDLLFIARDIALHHAAAFGVVTIEDVRSGLDRALGSGCWLPGNWMGSVFRGTRFVPTGGMVQTRHKGGHARLVREWRLK